MVLKLNTSICPIVEIGTYGTMLSPDYIFESESIDWEEAHADGRITEKELEYLCEASSRNFEFKRYLDAVAGYALHEIEDFLKDIRQFVKIGLANNDYETYSPREYNFYNDGMEYHVEVEQSEIDRLASELWPNREFMDWAYDTYRHRSGFISSMPFTRNEFSAAMGGKNIERALSMYLIWLLETEYIGTNGYDNPYQDSLIERFRGNNGINDFVNDVRFGEILDKIWEAA